MTFTKFNHSAAGEPFSPGQRLKRKDVDHSLQEVDVMHAGVDTQDFLELSQSEHTLDQPEMLFRETTRAVNMGSVSGQLSK